MEENQQTQENINEEATATSPYAAEEATEAEAAEAVEGAEENTENAEEAGNAEFEALKAKAADSEDKLLRLRADFENFRRRTRQEKEELANVVIQDFIKDLLPLVDNFDRAMAAEASDVETFKQGVEMIHNQFMEALKNKGLEAIETKDAKFDPNFHQAVMRVENPDLEDETIAMELQKGYVVKGKVIRPSMVQVVTNS